MSRINAHNTARHRRSKPAGRTQRLRRRLRTQSVLTLQLAGFALVALPLLAGLVVSSQQIGRVTRHSEQLLERAITATQSARQISDRVTAFERAARQYRILEDAAARTVLFERHRSLIDDLAAFSDRVDSPPLADRIEALTAESNRLHHLALEPGSDSDQEWPPRLAAPFAQLGRFASELLVATEKVAEGELQSVRSMGQSARNVALLSLVATVPVALMLGVLIAGFLNRRIRQLDRGMRALARPSRAPIEQIDSPRDLRALSIRLEWVRRRLLRSERDRQALVAQVSHELKTPLSAIREGISLLADQSFGALGAQEHEVIGIIQASTARLQEQIENLLRFNRLQSRPQPVHQTRVALDTLVDQVLDGHRLSIEAHGMRVVRGARSGIHLDADPDMLITAIDNLVSNAVKFSPAGGSIAVDVKSHNQSAQILVADRGPGIPAADRTRLFEPFYRGSSPHSQARPGSGLGLAICRDLVRAHGGEVRLGERAGWSAVFVIELPIDPAGDGAS